VNLLKNHVKCRIPNVSLAIPSPRVNSELFLSMVEDLPIFSLPQPNVSVSYRFVLRSEKSVELSIRWKFNGSAEDKNVR
jgi:hypothetical protein